MTRPFAQYPSLRNRVVFVTGGATGIGAALVAAFADQRAHVGFLDIDAENGEKLAARLREQGLGPVHFSAVDVTDADALRAALALCAQALGPVQVLINNVADDTRHDPQTVTAESWRRCLAINLDAAFFAAQAVYGAMANAGSGTILNMGSINALLGPAQMPGYVTAKAGLIGMTKALARDYGAAGVRVNAILPGWVVTERQLQLWLTPEAEAEWMKHVALTQRIEADDVARLALFLAADDSAMITGQCVTIDGGRT